MQVALVFMVHMPLPLKALHFSWQSCLLVIGLLKQFVPAGHWASLVHGPHRPPGADWQEWDAVQTPFGQSVLPRQPALHRLAVVSQYWPAGHIASAVQEVCMAMTH
jgi:hypothetical protein